MTGQAVQQAVAGRSRYSGQPAAHSISLHRVTGSDAGMIALMWERCTLASRTARFRAPVRNIPASYLEAVFADPASIVVAACHDCGAVVALASLIPDASQRFCRPSTAA